MGWVPDLLTRERSDAAIPTDVVCTTFWFFSPALCLLEMNGQWSCSLLAATLSLAFCPFPLVLSVVLGDAGIAFSALTAFAVALTGEHSALRICTIRKHAGCLLAARTGRRLS